MSVIISYSPREINTFFFFVEKTESVAPNCGKYYPRVSRVNLARNLVPRPRFTRPRSVDHKKHFIRVVYDSVIYIEKVEENARTARAVCVCVCVCIKEDLYIEPSPTEARASPATESG